MNIAGKCMVLIGLISMVENANIFFYFGTPFSSHRMSIWPLVTELARRGHNVTFYQPQPPTNSTPGVTELVLSDVVKGSLAPSPNYILNRIENGWWDTVLRRSPAMFDVGIKTCQLFLGSAQAREFINNSKFDMVVMDEIVCECGFGLAHVWNAKTVIFDPSSTFASSTEFMGLPDESLFFPDVGFCFVSADYFIQRVITQLALFYNVLYRAWIYHPELEGIMRQYLPFDQKQPKTLKQLLQDTSLRLVNSHSSIDGVQDLPPFNVHVGGMDLIGNTATQNVSIELQDFMASGEFIYVNFGSVVKFSKMPVKTMAAFLKGLERSHINFLLKLEGEPKIKIPGNVFASSWFPQKEVLKSPNCKGFIAHGGLSSIREGIAYGVPMILIPLFADQDYNALMQKTLGRAQVLHLETVTAEILQDAILELLENNEYKIKTLEASRQFHDRLSKPLDEAVYWIEYTLRHNGTQNHRFHQAANHYWFQRRLLDVWLFLLLITLLIIWMVYALLKLILKYVVNIGHVNNENIWKGKKMKTS